MKQSDLFSRIGYPRHAEKVYVFLSKKSRHLSVSEISLGTHLPRTTVYRCLRAMVLDKVVDASQIGKRTFYAVGSRHHLTKKMQLVESSAKQTLKHIPHSGSKDAPANVRFLYGSAGIRAAFDDVVTHSKKGDTFFRYTSERDLQKVNAYLANDYRIRRDKKKLERLVISNAISGTQKRSRLERFIKCIPPEANQFEQNIIQLVYGDRVSIIDIEAEEVTIFENKRFADFQKTVFQLLYRYL